MMYTALRRQMVQKFVIDVGITDTRVTEAMLRVPRHLFVDGALSHQAYSGSSLPIGFGQTISHPTTVALMTYTLALTGNEKILEIGTGSGYQAAVLAEIGVKVFTIERISELGNRARELYERLKYYTIAVKIGDGSLGWNEHAPFHRIIVTASAPHVPDSLVEQLADGGRLVIPVGDSAGQKLTIITRNANRLKVQEEDWRDFVPLIGRKGWSV